MENFLYILGHNIVPIFVLVLSGYALGKKFSIDMPTMSKLNFYLFVPAFMFVYLFTTEVNRELFMIGVCCLVMFFAQDIFAGLIGKMRGMDKGKICAFKNTFMYTNCGNIGIPLTTLVFTSSYYVVDGKTPFLDIAIAAQIIIMILQNIVSNTLGFYTAGRAKFNRSDSLKKIFSMPTIYVIPLVILFKVIGFRVDETIIWPALVYLKDGLVAIALLTLGIQLSTSTFDFSNFDVYLASLTRLIIGPLMTMVFIFLFGFTGVLAQVLLISYAVPTAVNMALVAVECDNEPDFTTQVVTISTLLSAVTMTFFIYMARVLYPIF